MDDLRLLRELGQETPLVGLGDLTRARTLLAAEIASTTLPEQEKSMLYSEMESNTSAEGRPRTPARRRPTRFQWALTATVTGAAAALAAAIVFVVGPGGAAVGGAAGSTATGTDDATRFTTVSVETVLSGAVAYALKTPDVTPRPDQFLYVKTTVETATDESWYSIDGHHPGLDKSTKRPGAKVLTTTIEPCTDAACTSAAYQENTPTDADAMLTYLKRDAVTGADKDVWIVRKILDMAATHYLRPQSLAALFQAAGKVPGIRVTKDVTDGAGRPGIGLAWSIPGTDNNKDLVMVFDAKTYTFLGTQRSAIEQVAIVDKAGQRP